MPDSIKCSKCDQEFTDEEAHIVHMNIDHGASEADSIQLSDDYSVPNGVRGYNPNPNAGLYDNKLFRTGSSTERTSILGEALNDAWNLNIDYPFKMSDEFEQWIRDAGIDVQWRTSMPENARIHALKQYQSGVSASDYQPYSYESYASEENPNHGSDGKFTSGSDKTDYSKKHDVFFKDSDGKVIKKNMTIRQYNKAIKDNDYEESAWGVNSRDLEREYKKQQTESYANEEIINWCNELLDIMRRNQPIRDFSGMLKQEGWNGLEETDVPIQDLISKGKVKYESGYGYIVTESYASEDFDIRHMEDDALNRKWENTVKLRDMKLNLYYNSGDQKYKEEADQIQSELDLIEAEWQMRDSKESYANEETEYTGGDFCAKCGTEFEDKGECKVCNNGEESSDNYEVDVDEYLKTGEPVQKLPNDKRTYEESYANEEDGTDFDNDGDIDSEDYLEAKDRAIKKSIRDDDDVDYDKEDEQTVGFIEQQHTEPKEDNNKELDDVDISEESIDYVYPTKASEARERSYTTEAKMVEGLEEEYDDFKDSDEEEVTETVTLRKLHGFSNESIARELHITYGVPHEEALEKVHSIEVSTNDKVAQTFFGKMYKECNESEKAELRMYSGSD
jgi:hypothetical protein